MSAAPSKRLSAGLPPTPARKAPSSVEKVRVGESDTFGYNAATDSYGDLVADGVIDPAKVTRTALQNAASIAGLMLTTEATIVEIPEDKPAAPPDPHGGEF